MATRLVALLPLLLFVTVTAAASHRGARADLRAAASDAAAAAAADPETGWRLWKEAAGREYGSEEEERARFLVWQNNVARVREHNAQEDAPYWQSLGGGADRRVEDLQPFPRGRRDRQLVLRDVVFTYEDTEPAAAVDWLDAGLVTAAKLESGCPACWAYSTTDAVESLHAMKTGTLTALSQQEVIDCAMSGENRDSQGCNMGYIDGAYDYILENGLATWMEYPFDLWGAMFASSANECDDEQRHGDERVVTVCDYEFVPQRSEEALKQAVMHQPVTVEVAVIDSFLNYGGGVYSDPECSSDGINHAMLLVGYGYDEETGLDYWLLKNSWGAYWGEAGFMRLERGVPPGGSVGPAGMCGVTICPIFPHMEAADDAAPDVLSQMPRQHAGCAQRFEPAAFVPEEEAPRGRRPDTFRPVEDDEDETEEAEDPKLVEGDIAHD